MKKRVISAIIALMICIPMLLIGGLLFDIGVIVIGLLGLKEFLHAREARKELPMFINFISYMWPKKLLILKLRKVMTELDLDFVVKLLILGFGDLDLRASLGGFMRVNFSKICSG